MEGNPHSEKRPCKYCKEMVPVKAKLCPTCKSYQSWYRNWLPYTLQIIALIGIIVSVITFLAKSWSQFFPRDKLITIELSSDGASTFFNAGDRDLYIKSIQFTSGLESMSVDVEKVVRKGEVLIHEQPKRRDGRVVGGLTDEKWQALLAEYGNDRQAGRIYGVFLSNDSPSLTMFEKYNRPLRKLPANARIHYVSLDGKSHVQEISEVTMIIIIPPPTQEGSPPKP